MLKIGLTGGLGSGKSTVASLFAAKGVPVFDADTIARELVEPGQSALAAIVAEFGAGILLEGRLNRSALRELIYADPKLRRILEGILHPKVYQSLSDKAAGLHEPYCVFVIPLLLETGRTDFVDRILLVDCPEELQYERARRRDGLDDGAIARIIAAQSSREDKCAVADDIIENAGTMDKLRKRVDELHQAYLLLTDGPDRGNLRAID